MSSDRTFDIGCLLYGERFKRLTRAISCMHPYLDMQFGDAWRGSMKRAMAHLDGEENTPLWFWRP